MKNRYLVGLFIESLHRIVFLIIVLITISLKSDTLSNPAEENIKGIVKNEEAAVPFARVRVQATDNFTLTDINGKFTLENISSNDTLVITAWAEGYYNGYTLATAGESNAIITLHKLPAEDNAEYKFLSPDKDSSSTLNCGNCHADVLMNQWRSDAHGQSAKNPFFYAMYNGTDINGEPNVGVGYKRDFIQTNGNCATCHIPEAALNNPWGINPNEIKGTEVNGVSCDFCHKIYKVNMIFPPSCRHEEKQLYLS